MQLLNFQRLWDSHPYPSFPCDRATFENQCAVRLGEALRLSGADLSTFRGAVCYPALNHNPKHILRAQELAEWLNTVPTLVRAATIHRNVTATEFQGQKGIVFIRDGWGATDHIDVWDGELLQMKGGNPDWFRLGSQVWFWRL